MADTIIVAYSGGLDTSVLVKMLQQRYDVDVVKVIVNVGQQKDLCAIVEKARVEKDKKCLRLTERDRDVIAF